MAVLGATSLIPACGIQTGLADLSKCGARPLKLEKKLAAGSAVVATQGMVFGTSSQQKSVWIDVESPDRKIALSPAGSGSKRVQSEFNRALEHGIAVFSNAQMHYWTDEHCIEFVGGAGGDNYPIGYYGDASGLVFPLGSLSFDTLEFSPFENARLLGSVHDGRFFGSIYKPTGKELGYFDIFQTLEESLEFSAVATFTHHLNFVPIGMSSQNLLCYLHEFDGVGGELLVFDRASHDILHRWPRPALQVPLDVFPLESGLVDCSGTKKVFRSWSGKELWTLPLYRWEGLRGCLAQGENCIVMFKMLEGRWELLTLDPATGDETSRLEGEWSAKPEDICGLVPVGDRSCVAMARDQGLLISW